MHDLLSSLLPVKEPASLTNQWERRNTTVTFPYFIAGYIPGPEKEPAFQPLLLSIASVSSGTHQTFP